MERPTIDPATGDAKWQPNGARQRYAQQMLEELGFTRVFVAACQIMRGLMVERGEIEREDGISLSKADVVNWLQWRTLRQLKIIRKIAEDLGEPEKLSTH